MVTAIGAATVAIWVYLLLFRGGFWWLPYRPAPIAANVGGRSVVAVIPARDEAAVVGPAVASLLAQDYDGNFHIVVVDDQSRDGTAAAADDLPRRARPAGVDRQALGGISRN